MNVQLLHPDRDLDLSRALRPDAGDLVQDLALEPLFAAMACGDQLALQVARAVLLADEATSPEVATYRQEAVVDCLAERVAVRALYGLAGKGLADVRDLGFLRLYSSYPTSTLYSALRVLGVVADTLTQMLALMEEARPRFHSRAFARLFDQARSELNTAFFDDVRFYRQELEFRAGMLASARLGVANRGAEYTLRRAPVQRRGFLASLRRGSERGLTFTIPGPDEAGHTALQELKGRTINGAANALAQANDQMLAYFADLRAELAFYLACVNLHDALTARGAAVVMPSVEPVGTRALRARGLVDVSLVLGGAQPVVANDVDVDRCITLVVTGANRGGKTTFLRSMGQAQLMMAAGMEVAAQSFAAAVCDRVFTHFRREEDTSMTAGKLDEELSRLVRIVDRLGPESMVLMNETFGSTNEAEGSELARQVVTALAAAGIRVVFVTHMSAFALALEAEGRPDEAFFRAERLADGTRTFRVLPGGALETSFALDVYGRVFGEAAEGPAASA